MTKNATRLLLALAVSTLVAGSFSLGSGRAQTAQTPLQKCTNALEECGAKLQACQGAPGGVPKVAGKKGGFTWHEADMKNIELLLRRSVELESLDPASFSQATKSVIEGNAASSAAAAGKLHADALQEVAARVSAKSSVGATTPVRATQAGAVQPQRNVMQR